MTEVMSFEINHKQVEMLYDGVGWIIQDGFMQYHQTFAQASEAMDDLIMLILGREE